MLIAPGACPALNSSVVLHNHNKQVWKAVSFGFFQITIPKHYYINRLLYLTSKYLWPARRSSWATRTGTEVGTPTTSSKFPFKPHIVLQYEIKTSTTLLTQKKKSHVLLNYDQHFLCLHLPQVRILWLNNNTSMSLVKFGRF